MRCRHRMPFGAKVLENGETRFALWAPAAGTVELVLESEVLPMPREGDGCFSLTTGASPGDRYRIDGGQEVPDPASRYQPEDAHGPSQVVDPAAFDWGDEGWTGRPWYETVLYELHVGSFGPGGRRETPWGAAINFDGEGSGCVREFFIHNALYWIEEYRLDGLRLDAVHAIRDDSDKHFLVELAERVRKGPGRNRRVHLVLENEANAVPYLRGENLYDAQWNDDLHNGLHVALTGESSGYYSDFSDAPVRHLGRCLAEGFAYQGEPSRHKEGEKRGEPSGDLPPSSFVSFLQNHDQVGNRAFGDRISTLAPPEAVRAAVEVYLLSPQVPMLFMGEEWGASTPFLFFCDFEPALASLVTEGRREEFARFPAFSDLEIRDRIPDPSDEETFRASVLDWGCLGEPEHRSQLDLYRELLALRRERITPRLEATPGGQSEYRLVGERGLTVQWRLGDGSLLTLFANLASEPLGGLGRAEGDLLYASGGAAETGGELPGWSVAWYLREAG